MLDTNERFMSRSTAFAFIEPYPDRLYGLLKKEDKDSCVVIEKPVQDVSPDLFQELDDGDVLFIDSSHVSKIGSDVNHLLFNILPALRACSRSFQD